MENIHVGTKLYCIYHDCIYTVSSINIQERSMYMRSEDGMVMFHSELTEEILNKSYIVLTGLSDQEIKRKKSILKLKK